MSPNKINLRSIRWRLPFTYAGIALITALAMGTVLLLTLRGYYDIQERAYLERNANAVSLAITPLLKAGNLPDELGTQIKLLAFLSQTRVQWMDANGKEVVDSGIPGTGSPVMVSEVSLSTPGADSSGRTGYQMAKPLQGQTIMTPVLGSDGPGLSTVTIMIGGPNAADIHKEAIQLPFPATPGKLQFFYTTSGSLSAQTSPPTAPTTLQPAGATAPEERKLVGLIPASGTMFGFDLQPASTSTSQRSSQAVYSTILSSDGKTLGTLTISDGPAIGSEIIAGVERVGVLAALVAVLISAGVGWWISRRMSAPLLILTESTRRMAGGDLSARSGINSQDEFGALSASFNEMAQQVEEMVDSLRCFASDAAHELQTPLTALHTNLELALQDQQDNSNLLRSWQQFQRLERLSTDLLDLSRIENSSQGSAVEPVDLAGLIQGIREKYASEAEQSGQVFSLDLPEKPVMVAGRAEQLLRAITNLLDNAFKFTPPGGKIEAGLVQEDGSVTVWVADHGIGIPAEDQAHLFQRFHRAHNVSDYPGSGLGLAIVQAIVQKHGGRVWFETLERGTKFSIQLKGE